MRNPPFAVIWTELDRNTVNQAEKDKYHMIYPVHHTEEGLMAFRSEGGRRARDRHVTDRLHISDKQGFCSLLLSSVQVMIIHCIFL